MDSRHGRYMYAVLALQIVMITSLALLTAWTIVGVHHPASQSRPAVLPLGSLFDANQTIPIQAFEAAFRSGQVLMTNDYQRADWCLSAHNWMAWTSRILCVVIALIVWFVFTIHSASKRRSSAAQAPLNVTMSALQNDKVRNESLVNWHDLNHFTAFVGILAAAASILLANSSYMEYLADRHQQDAITIRNTLALARRRWYDGRTRNDALQTIADLKRTLQAHR